jgi:hypothetical protein
MGQTDDEARIGRALAGRRQEQARVERLVTAWSELSRAFAALGAAGDDADRVAGSLPRADDALTRVQNTVSDLQRQIRGRRDLEREILEVGERIASLQHRVGRQTVNVGVIGKTKAGKSTLLRAITGLPPGVIPSSTYSSTTAAPSRIYHDPTESSAVVHLHTWDSFRQTYLDQVQTSAGLGHAPRTLSDFTAHHYPDVVDVAERADRQRFLNRLLVAQRSLPSYQDLLRAGDRSRRVDLSALRPYIAYPEDDADTLDRPYHAVAAVEIRHPFPRIGSARLGLVDLPGAGEAGLDVDRQFLRRLRDDLDLLLMVKRTMVNEAFWSDADWDSIGLADSARVGVALEDFVHIVVNEDPSQLPPEGLERTTREMRSEAAKRGIRVFSLNAQEPATVHAGLMEPLLRHLAERLSVMDRAATQAVLAAAQEVAGKLEALAETVTQHLSGWQAVMPNEQKQLYRHARRLRHALAAAVGAISDRYTADAAQGKADPAFEAAVRSMAGQARDWTKGGLGAGNRAAWFAQCKSGGFIAEPAGLREREYADARAKVGELFSRVDASIDESIDQLCAEIAEALRAQLTEEIVPAGENGTTTLARLRDAAGRSGQILPEALKDLVDLRDAYGSALLRVTRPIVRTITESGGRVRATPAAGPSGGPSGATDTHAEVMARLRRSATAYGPPSPTPSAGSARSTREPTGWSGSGGAGGVSEADGQVAGAQKQAERLYDELTSLVGNRIDELEKALLAEGNVMLAVLAAATERFLDLATKSPEIELEYLQLCQPVQRRLWPDFFDGGQAQLEAGLVDLESAASSLAATAADVRRLDR